VIAKLLVAEDEPAVAGFLADHLRDDDYDARVVGTVAEAESALLGGDYEIAILDVGLPDGSGFDLCRAIRRGECGTNDIGVIMLTGRTAERDVVRAFERGADDFVRKPFSYPELLGRITALRSRLDGPRHARLECNGVAVDVSTRAATVDGTLLVLPAKEFDLLAALLREPDRVIGKDELLRRVWGYQGGAITRTVDSHASRLRRRLEDATGGRERLVVNHWGIGYSFLPTAR